MDPGDRAHALDLLAGELRERLLREVEGEAERTDAQERIRALVDREAGVLAAGGGVELTARIAERSFGLGPLEPLLRDPAVEEIMVSGTAPVWIERAGRLEPTGVRFAGEAPRRGGTGGGCAARGGRRRPTRWGAPGPRGAGGGRGRSRWQTHGCPTA